MVNYEDFLKFKRKMIAIILPIFKSSENIDGTLFQCVNEISKHFHISRKESLEIAKYVIQDYKKFTNKSEKVG